MRQGIKERDIRDFVKCANKLNIIIDRIRDYYPEANLYVAENELCLLSGQSHSLDFHREKNTDAVVSSVIIHALDCGSW